MRWLSLLFALTCTFSLLLTACTSCTQQQTPDQIRQETANATAKLKQDTVAVAQGLKEGVTKPKTVDINAGTRQDLVSTLGVSDQTAERIISLRPYDNPDQLVTKRAVTNAEYDRIKDKVAVKTR